MLQFLMVCSLCFIAAMMMSGETITLMRYHTYAHIGVILALLMVLFLRNMKIHFSVIPILASFGIPMMLMISQHAGLYPYGIPEGTKLVNYQSLNGIYIRNPMISRRILPLIKNNDELTTFFYQKYRSDLYEIVPKKFSQYGDAKVQQKNYEIPSDLQTEYDNYTCNGRYESAVFIKNLNSGDPQRIFWALNLLAMMDVVEKGISDAVFVFLKNDDEQIRELAEQIIDKENKQNND